MMLDLLFPCFAVLALVILALLIRSKINREQEYAYQIELSAKSLDLKVKLESKRLAKYVRPLMPSAQEVRCKNLLKVDEPEGEIIIFDCELVQSQSSSNQTVSLLYIADHDVPSFQIREPRLFDDFGFLIGWSVIEIAGQELFNRSFVLRSPVGQMKQVTQFFAARPELIEFCLAHPNHRLTCDGKSLVFYRPRHRMMPDETTIRLHIELIRKLYRILV